MGREFLRHFAIKIDCTQLRPVSEKTNDVPKQLRDFPELHKPGVGHFPDSKHRIRLTDNVVPFATRTGPILYRDACIILAWITYLEILPYPSLEGRDTYVVSNLRLKPV